MLFNLCVLLRINAGRKYLDRDIALKMLVFVMLYNGLCVRIVLLVNSRFCILEFHQAFIRLLFSYVFFLLNHGNFHSISVTLLSIYNENDYVSIFSL